MKGTNISYKLHITYTHHTSLMQQVAGSRSTEIWTPWKPGAWRRARWVAKDIGSVIESSSWFLLEHLVETWYTVLCMCICLYAENDNMHEAGWNLKLLVSDHWVWSQDCQRSFWVLTRNVEKGESSWSFSVTGVQKHRIFGPSATSGVKGGRGHSRLFVFFCCKKSIFCFFFCVGL